ncbi:MAG: ImmA/IrrE family metallo-endopeptidase [Promethearchaeota archaeon]
MNPMYEDLLRNELRQKSRILNDELKIDILELLYETGECTEHQILASIEEDNCKVKETLRELEELDAIKSQLEHLHPLRMEKIYSLSPKGSEIYSLILTLAKGELNYLKEVVNIETKESIFYAKEKEILEAVSNSFEREWIKFCKAGKRDRLIIMNDLARNIAHRTLYETGYTFEFKPTPLDNLLKLFNIRIVDEPNLDGDALLIKEKDGWTIKQNRDMPEERKRFSLSHEIAHILLKDVVKRYPRLLKLEELFCDKIASEILAPGKIFEINNIDNVLSEIEASIPKILHLVEYQHLEELHTYKHEKTGKRLNLAIFEAMCKHLAVSRPTLVRKLHQTKLLNELNSGALICFEGARGLRVVYRATPSGLYIPKGIECDKIGLPNNFDIERGIGDVSLKFKKKIDGKWVDVCENVRVESKIFPWKDSSNYLFMLFNIP